jgi:hypothetical protein
MGARAHGVRNIRCEYGAPSGLVQHDDVSKALAAERPDDALNAGVLPWRARRSADGLDVHVRDRGCDVGKPAIPIMEEVGGYLVFGEGVPQLLGGLRCGRLSVTATCTIRRRSWARMTSTKSSRKVTAGTTKNPLPSLGRVIREERAPRLRGRGPVASHVLRDGGLTHRNAQLQQLAVNPRCTPERFADESSRIRARTSFGTPGRPVRRRLVQVQNRRSRAGATR